MGRIHTMLLAAVLAGGCAAAAADPAKGETVRQVLPIARYQVALPPGDWHVVNEHVGTITIDGMPNGPRWKALQLVQYDEQRRLVAFFEARATTITARVSEWNVDLCRRTDTLYRDTLDGSVKMPECLLINHLVRYYQAVPKDEAYKPVWEWLRANEVKVPPTVIGVQTRFHRMGDFLYVNYAINPELAGFEPATQRDWADSDWHPLKVKGDPARQAYVERLKAWALQNAKVHRAALTNEAAPAGLAPIPR